MATFSVDFLGCKVSHADAQAVRERLLADGHAEGAGRRRRAEHVLRHPRGAAQVAPRRLAGGPHPPARLRDRLRREPLRRRVRRSPRERRRDRQAERGDAGRDRGRRRRDRLRPGRRAARPRPRVREGAGRLLVLVQLLRDPPRARRLAQPPRGRGARRDPPPRRPGPPRGRPHRDQPRLLPRPRGGLRPAAPDPRGGRDARARAVAAVLDRGQPRERARCSPRSARRRPCRRHLHVPLQSGDDGVLRAMARRYDSATWLRRVGARRATST